MKKEHRQALNKYFPRTKKKEKLPNVIINTPKGVLMKMDWKKETKGEFIVYPAGTYHVRIVGYEYAPASTGTQQIRWRAEIIKPEEYRGKTILDHTALTERALWRTAKMVSACGVDTSDCEIMDTESKSFNLILNACKERRLYWQLIEEIGQNGKPRNSVVDYLLDDTQETIKPLDDDLPWKE